MLTRNLEIWKAETVREGDIFFELESERREWEISKVIPENYNSEILSCFSRVIAISLELELPVGAFVRSLVERESDIPKNAYRGLILNIEDEEKHFRAFKAIQLAYPVFQKDVDIAKAFRQRILHMGTHPLIKARDLETIIFIPLQTVLRYYGSQSLERIVASISFDEYRHVQYNWEISAILNIGFDREYEEYLMNIANWVFEPLKNFALDYRFWIDCTREQRLQGQCQRLSDLMNYGIHRSPFELSNATY